MNQLLEILARRDIRMRWEDGRLKCDAPKGALTPELSRQITLHREELIAHLQRQRPVGRSGGPIEPRIWSGPLPLSFSQRRLLVLEELSQSAAAYILPALLRFRGEIQPELLAEALRTIMMRHLVLRTTLVFSQGNFHGVEQPEPSVPLQLFDLRSFSGEARQLEIERLVNQTTGTPFILAQELPLRTALLQLEDEEYLFAVALHHSAADGWSIGIFQRELAAAYNALVCGEGGANNCGGDEVSGQTPPLLPPLPIQYADYAAWQEQLFAGPYREQKCAWWSRELQGADQVLALPTQLPRPALQSFNGAGVDFTLEPATLEALRRLASEAGATLFMALLAVYGLFLMRSSGQEEILVGVPMHNRLRPELEGLIGYFSDTVPLRLRLGGRPTFLALLDRVRQAAIGAYENQDLPFDLLVNALKPRRDLSRNPLVQVMFALHNAPLHGPKARLELAGAVVEAVKLEQHYTRLELEMHLWESPEGLSGTLFYNTDLFTAVGAAEICRRYCHLLRAAVQDPRTPISRLPWLDEEESRLIIREWNATRQEHGDKSLLHERFHALAQADPAAPALVSGSKRLNRGELNRLAGQIAAALQAAGVEPGELVGICTARSWCAVAAMLGILQAGCAYVPLDPAHPPARQEFMAGDAGLGLILTESGVAAELASWWQGPLLRVDGDLLPPPREAAVSKGDPDDLCYLIYTSGSTGTPKGVRVRHRSVVNMLEALWPRLEVNSTDIWTLFHSPAFDFSVWEIWGALLSGGTLVTVEAEVARNPEAFYRLVVEEGVSVLNQTPTALEQFAVCHAEQGAPLRLGRIICGGESLPVNLAARVLAWGIPLWNFYGPTEATVWAAAHRVEARDLEQTAIPVGRPLANMRLYVLDPEGNPLPANTPGELWIGGVGVAAGYHKRPELSGEKFVPDPFEALSSDNSGGAGNPDSLGEYGNSGEPGKQGGGRLYRSGDLARFAPDGTLTLLGREDRQTKLRGFRIELGEIEHTLGTLCPAARVVVVVQPASGGEGRIVAYLAGRQIPDIESLKQQLRAILPEYMVPQVMVRLDKLPLSANGKIDLKALPSISSAELLSEAEEAASMREYRAPRTGLERLLTAAWAEVLERERLGIDDNLFDLGATSLLVFKVHRKVRANFEHRLTVSDFFRYPTIVALAAHLTTFGGSYGQGCSQSSGQSSDQSFEKSGGHGSHKEGVDPAVAGQDELLSDRLPQGGDAVARRGTARREALRRQQRAIKLTRSGNE